MEWWLGAVVVVIYSILRLAVPLGLMALIGYGVRRLDKRWHPLALASGGE